MANTQGSFLLPFAVWYEEDTVLVFKMAFSFVGLVECIQKQVLGESRLLWTCQRWMFPPKLWGGSFQGQRSPSDHLFWVLYLGASSVLQGLLHAGSALQLWCSRSHVVGMLAVSGSSCTARGQPQHCWLVALVLHCGSNTSSSSPGAARWQLIRAHLSLALKGMLVRVSAVQLFPWELLLCALRAAAAVHAVRQELFSVGSASLGPLLPRLQWRWRMWAELSGVSGLQWQTGKGILLLLGKSQGDLAKRASGICRADGSAWDTQRYVF